MIEDNAGNDAENADQANASDDDGNDAARNDAAKVQEIAERAGGGSNKGSDLGSNEDIDQAGGQQGGDKYS